MQFATTRLGQGRVAVVLTKSTFHHFAPGLEELVSPSRDFSFLDMEEAPRKLIHSLNQLNPTGIIMEYRETLLESILSLNKPIVLVLADMLVHGMGCVNTDDYAVGSLAAEYLWQKKLTSFARIGFDTPHAPERKSGFSEFLAEKGHYVETFDLELTAMEPGKINSTRMSLKNWLQRLHRPVGLFAEQSNLARELLDTCKRIDIPVPEELALLSVNDTSGVCDLIYPPISSINIPWQKIAINAAHQLDQLIQGRAPEPAAPIPPTGIRIRGSSEFYQVTDIRIKKATTFMEDNFSKRIDMSDIAKAAGVNRRTMERLFRDELGSTPKETLTAIRVRNARERLETTNQTITQIAEISGFTSSEYLAKYFRRHYKASPRQWRKLRNLKNRTST